jgi:hypothetical protein
MGLSSEMIDQLSFSRDGEMNKKTAVHRKKVTSSTEVNLEEYFSFLDDAALFFLIVKRDVTSERKVKIQKSGKK